MTAEPVAIPVTAHSLASRFLGIEELDRGDHPLIQWGFMLCGLGSEVHDEVAWCSAFAQIPAEMLGLPRSRNARARSWLRVGREIALPDARKGFDVVVFQRGDGPQPGPQIIDAPGHVAYFDRLDGPRVWVLGGNQSDSVTVASFPASRVLGIRRISPLPPPPPGMRA